MRILFIQRNLDRAELDMVLDVHRRGIFIRVLTTHPSRYRDILTSEGIYIGARPFSSKFSLRLILQIRRLIREHNIDIVHATDGKSIANAVWATYGLNVRIVAYRGTLAKIRRSDISYWMGVLNPRISRIICVNRSILDYMQNFHPREKLVLNYKGYSPEWNESTTQIEENFKRACQDKFVVMYIASTRQRPHKGLENLVRAVAQTAIPNLLMVHIGSHDDHIASLARRATEEGRIMLMGERAEASQYLEYADIFVLPSSRDGLPRSVKEAMSRATPVISTNIPGPTEMVIHEKTGLVVEPDNPEQLARAIETLHHDSALREKLGLAGQQYLLKHFSPQAFADTTIATYQELEDISARRNP